MSPPIPLPLTKLVDTVGGRMELARHGKYGRNACPSEQMGRRRQKLLVAARQS